MVKHWGLRGICLAVVVVAASNCTNNTNNEETTSSSGNPNMVSSGGVSGVNGSSSGGVGSSAAGSNGGSGASSAAGSNGGSGGMSNGGSGGMSNGGSGGSNGGASSAASNGGSGGSNGGSGGSNGGGNGSSSGTVTCPNAGDVNCGGSCIDPLTNPQHCGATLACGNPAGDPGELCLGGKSCVNGVCQLSACPMGYVLCIDPQNGMPTCIDPNTSDLFCGATMDCSNGNAGQQCTNGAVCNGSGSCQLNCLNGLLRCGGGTIYTGYASLGGIAPFNTLGGQGQFTSAPRLSTLRVQVYVAPPGDHLVRIYDGASCTQRGNVLYDVGVLTVGANGGGTLTLSTTQFRVGGVDSIVNKPLVIASPGDGGATAIACGIINATGSSPEPQICVDPNTDELYCGAQLDCMGTNAGLVCPNNSQCVGGTCLNCLADEIACNGVCVNPDLDETYCGATLGCGLGTPPVGTDGATCVNGYVCVDGACVPPCPPTQVYCNGQCIDPFSSPTYCGATGACGLNGNGTAGDACSPVEDCVNGSCVCPAQGEVECNQACINPLNTDAYCGATQGCGQGGVGTAGDACITGVETCINGLCVCPIAGQLVCNGACIDPLTDEAFCGATLACGVGGVGTAGDTCIAGVEQCLNGLCVCPIAGQIVCNGVCIDPLADEGFCGATLACGVGGVGTAGDICIAGVEECLNGSCLCPVAGQIVCNNLCIDPQTDETFCGATLACGVGGVGTDGNTCLAVEVCLGGTCQCPNAGDIICDGVCIDPDTNPLHCGATLGCGLGGVGLIGDQCDITEMCSTGVCVPACPNANEVYCGTVCIDPLTDETFCGATPGCGFGGVGTDGNICLPTEECTAGNCQPICPVGQVACNGVCIDPLWDNNFCGATYGCGLNGVGTDGDACGNGFECFNGTCQFECPNGTIRCGAACINPDTDTNFCGATYGCGFGGIGTDGNACNATQVCNGYGECTLSCVHPFVECGNTCIDPKTNNTFCGATPGCGAGAGTNGDTCLATQACGNGTCVNVNACPVGFLLCNGTCVNPLFDRDYCGAQLDCLNANAGDDCDLTEECFGGFCVASNHRYQGSLPVQNGAWNYGGQLGLSGATNLCRLHFGTTSNACTPAQMVQASGRGDLANPFDINFAQVNKWWVHDPAGNASTWCGNNNNGGAPWTYPTGDQGHSGNFTALINRALGTITAITITAEAGNFCRDADKNVACCRN